MAEGSEGIDVKEPSLLVSRTCLTTDRWDAATNALLPFLESLKVKLRVQKARVVDFS